MTRGVHCGELRRNQQSSGSAAAAYSRCSRGTAIDRASGAGYESARSLSYRLSRSWALACRHGHSRQDRSTSPRGGKSTHLHLIEPTVTLVTRSPAYILKHVAEIGGLEVEELVGPGHTRPASLLRRAAIKLLRSDAGL